MPRLLILISSLMVGAALGGCGRAERAPDPPSFEAGGFRWASFPVTLQPEPKFLSPRGAGRDLRAAISFWESRAGRQLFAVGAPWRGGLPYEGPTENPSSIRANAIFFQSPWTHEGDVGGKAVLLVRSEKITAGMILLDPGLSLCTGPCEDPGAATSLRKLLAHELGHLLGLPHAADPGNVMHAVLSPSGPLEALSVDLVALRPLVN